ncbi:MAG: OB-fold nucleic acid binding domain-containing protein, partial [Candidatus Paceibacterota bacterium]
MLEDIIQERRNKLEEYRKTADPYPAKTKRDFILADFSRRFSELEKEGKEVSVVGRVNAWRDQGKIIFADIKDESGRCQTVLNEREFEGFARAAATTDLGDFVEVSGTPFLTKRGEQSILVKQFRIITKSLRPIPSEWYGIEDEELKLRKRYLDLLTHPET